MQAVLLLLVLSLGVVRGGMLAENEMGASEFIHLSFALLFSVECACLLVALADLCL